MKFWVGDDDPPRRLSFELKDSQMGDSKVSAVFSRFGETVDIEAPPADQLDTSIG